MSLIAVSYSIETHGTDFGVGLCLLSGETLLQVKTSLVVGGTRTQVLADSNVTAASTLTIAPRRHLERDVSIESCKISLVCGTWAAV